MIFRRTILTLLVAASVSTAARADVVLARYDFGTTTTPSLASSDTDLNSFASAFTAGPDFLTALTPSTALGNPAPCISIGATTTPNAQSANGYYSFTLTPVSAVNLTTLTFDYAVSGTVTANYLVQAAVGAGSYSNVGSSVSTGLASWTTTTPALSLSAPQFQNVTLPVTFRIYIWDNKTGGSMSDLLDNVTVNGFTAVPEPSTWAMMVAGAGLLGATQRLRGRKRR